MAEDALPTVTEHQADDSEEDAELYSVVTTGRSAGTSDALTTVSRDGEEAPFHKIEFIHDVPLKLSVEIGQTSMSVRDILALNVGRVVEFTKVVGEPMDITISGRLMARGEIVVVNERYGVRISEVTRPDETGQISYGEN
ncbi:MAG: flagellar motor switch protein FliN [Gammaproteobacteria bacterium]|nr:flagellar motor switch protein FliN [Gammaproteobacteria bacterium]NIR96613.1 flagellar motor switch protein FliN [Gammaproteobacteria bacterium]NIT63110.1 flagellar motor switch protein FliN [Gammaproteobacteria bacterium]NIV20069.1 flagellar motor switch protein FliN [Gammaproteobacteria bacterium]NIY31690.1 flagellar motor switch protein FliN [Gammaproteobacteria bacterium]